jgi:SNF2 family DNA or RNA helicase
MGLGKTIQTIALLAALYKKTGTGMDLHELNQRKKIIESILTLNEAKRDELLLKGVIAREDEMAHLPPVCTNWCPVLVAAPNTVVQNWVDDFATWSHFALDVYRGKNREASLEKVKNGIVEVLICGHSMIQSKDHIDKLKTVAWKIVIVDE